MTQHRRPGQITAGPARPSLRLISGQAHPAIGAGAFGQVPDGVAFRCDAPAPEVTVPAHRGRSAQDAQPAALFQHTPVVRDEIYKLTRIVEDEFG